MTDYVVLLERSKAGWGAWSPDLDIYATGATRELAEEQIRGAVAFHLEGLREIKAPAPQPAVTAITVTA
jgi:predicted RNase H-like HicB family nuclease